MIDLFANQAHNQLAMPKLNHISVEIDATFGSNFQEEVALHLLQKLVYAWKAAVLEKHSSNAIEFRITNAVFVTGPRRKRRKLAEPSNATGSGLIASETNLAVASTVPARDGDEHRDTTDRHTAH